MPRCAGFPPWGRTSSLASGSGFEAAPMIDGLSLRMDDTAVVVTSPRPLTILSSAVHGGGFQSARTIINLHVAKHDPCVDPAAMLDAFARRAAVPVPYVGLLTGSWTELATTAQGQTLRRTYFQAGLEHSPCRVRGLDRGNSQLAGA